MDFDVADLLNRTVTHSRATSKSYVVTLNGQGTLVGGVRRAVEMIEDIAGEAATVMRPSVQFRLADLSRKPRRGDTVQLVGGDTWHVEQALETMPGMVDCLIVDRI